MTTITPGPNPAHTPKPAHRAGRRRTAVAAVPLSIAAFALLASACAPEPRYLSQMDPIACDSSCPYEGAVNVNGQWYYHTTMQSGNRYGNLRSGAVYDLERRYTSFKGILAMDRYTHSSANYLVQVRADGRVILERYVNPSSAHGFDLDVRNIAWLELRVYSNTYGGTVAWANGRIS